MTFSECQVQAHYSILSLCWQALNVNMEVPIMFINKTSDGLNNICGKNISKFRKEMGISQRELAVLLQVGGLDIDKNAIQRIESGKRFVTDIELAAFSKAINKSLNDLLL